MTLIDGKRSGQDIPDSLPEELKSSVEQYSNTNTNNVNNNNDTNDFSIKVNKQQETLTLSKYHGEIVEKLRKKEEVVSNLRKFQISNIEMATHIFQEEMKVKLMKDVVTDLETLVAKKKIQYEDITQKKKMQKLKNVPHLTTSYNNLYLF